jgi:hypothetical protein
MDTSHHDPNSPIVSFMSAPRTVARESSPTTPSDEVHTTNWSLPPRPRVRPSEHMIFRDRLDSALDVLRSPSPLFSEMDYRPLGSTFVGHIHGDQTWEGSSAPFRAPASSSSQSERLSSERGRRIEPQPESGMHVPPRSHGMSTLGPARGTSSRTRTGMRRFSFERPRQTDRETDAVMSDLDLALLPPYRPFYHGSSDTRSTRGDSGFYALRLTDSAALSDQGDERSHFRPGAFIWCGNTIRLISHGDIEHSHTEDLTARHSDHVDFENSHLPYSEGMAGPDHNHDGAPGWRGEVPKLCCYVRYFIDTLIYSGTVSCIPTSKLQRTFFFPFFCLFSSYNR